MDKGFCSLYQSLFWPTIFFGIFSFPYFFSDKIDRLKIFFNEYNDQNIDKKTFEFQMKQWLADIRGISNEEEIM